MSKRVFIHFWADWFASLRIRTRLKLSEQSLTNSIVEQTVVCPGKIGPILKRVLRDARKGQDNGTTEIYAGADHREAT